MFIILFTPDCLHLLQFGALCTLCCIYVLWAYNIIEKKLKLFVLPENWQSVSRIMILIPTLVFWISNPKSIFVEIWSEKVKTICFAWKLAHTHTHTHTHTQRESILRILILILRLVFWNFKPIPMFWENFSR